MANSYDGTLKFNLDVDTSGAKEEFDSLTTHITRGTNQYNKDWHKSSREVQKSIRDIDFSNLYSNLGLVKERYDGLFAGIHQGFQVIDRNAVNNAMKNLDADSVIRYDEALSKLYESIVKQQSATDAMSEKYHELTGSWERTNFDSIVEEYQSLKEVIQPVDEEYQRLTDLQVTLQNDNANYAQQLQLVAQQYGVNSQEYRQLAAVANPIMAQNAQSINDIDQRLISLNNTIDSLGGEYERFRELSGVLQNLNTNPDAVREMVNLENAMDSGNLRVDSLKTKFMELQQEIINAGEEGRDRFTLLGAAANIVENTFEEIKTTLSSLGEVTNWVTNKFKGFISKQVESIKKFNLMKTAIGKVITRFNRLVKRILIWSVLLKGLRALRTALGNILKANNEVVASLGKIKANLWTAFAPIYERILPYVKLLLGYVNWLAKGMAQFTSALTGHTIKESQELAKQLAASAKSTDSTAKSAEKLKNTLGSLDELNVISSPNNDSSGSSASTEIPLVWEDYTISKKVRDFIDMLKRAFETGDFYPVGMTLGTKLKEMFEGIPWETIQEGAKNAGIGLATFLNGIVDSGVISTLGKTLGEGLNTIIDFLNNFAMTFEWKGAGEEIGKGVTNFFETTDWTEIGNTISNLTRGILQFVSGAIEAVNWSSVAQGLVDLFCGVDWVGLAYDFSKLGYSVGGAIWEVMTGEEQKVSWEDALETIAQSLENGEWLDAFALWGEDIWDNVKAMFTDLSEALFGDTLQEIADSVAGGEWVDAFAQWGQDIWDSITGVLFGLVDWISENVIGPILSKIDSVKQSVNEFFGPGEIEGKVKEGGFKTHIPGYATGTVVPASSGEFLARLGDNNRETEVVSPLSTMKQAMLEALNESGGLNNNSGEQNIVLQMDGDTLFNWMIKKNKETYLQTHQNKLIY